MRHMSNRTVLVKKSELLSAILKNKDQHIIDYNDAVIAFKKEAAEQIALAQSKLESGSLENIKLNLIVPINKSDEYDKITTMFNWEIKDEVELSQNEFNEYVLDEAPFAAQARFTNSSYKDKWS